MNLLVRMLREEWRHHVEIFGPRRFAAFPIGMTIVAAITCWFLLLGETTVSAVAVGLHALVFLFGLHVGTVGFIGRDALKNLLGGRTLLVFSARTLPISQSRLLAAFLVKDLLYYAVWFIAPLVVAIVPFAAAAGESPLAVLSLWLTTAGSFMLGVTLSLLLAAVYTRSRPAVLLVAVGTATGIWRFGSTALDWTPLAFHAEPSLASLLSGFVPIIVLGSLGLWLFEPAALGGHRTTTDRFRAVRSLLPSDEHGIVAWTLFDVVRSSGSVWKVVFSMGVLFAVAAFLVGEVATLTGIQPAPGITFGALLGLGSFTVYSWITQFDAPETYLLYPIGLPDVVRAKFVAFMLLTIPIAVGYMLLAAILFGTSTVLVGLVVLVFVSVGVFGLTAFVTGLEPNELLFDTPRFLKYGTGIVLVVVPLLVAALAHPEYPTIAVAFSIGLSVVAAVVGVLLTRRAGPALDERARSA